MRLPFVLCLLLAGCGIDPNGNQVAADVKVCRDAGMDYFIMPEEHWFAATKERAYCKHPAAEEKKA